MTTLGVGIIGCGNISTTYLRLSPLFRGFEILAVADIATEAAEARAAEFGVRAETVDDLLAAEDIDLVVNLTIPDAHFDVTRRILEAGKHAYSEKPFVLSLDDGKTLAALAQDRGLRLGSAPDTFLGGAHQAARAVIDAGEVGRITSGTCHVLSKGMEHWHPNPDFFFVQGGGPILDLGPYYITNLIQLIGPVGAVTAMTGAATDRRTITNGPRSGETVPVETPTTIHGLMQFESGAIVTLGASWDVFAHGHDNMELYGSAGALRVPDPNFFAGEVKIADTDGKWQPRPADEHPFYVPNEDHDQGPMANYRCAGLADMAQAIGEGREHRCNAEVALHAVDVMTGLLRAGETRSWVEMTTSCERPAALSAGEARDLLI